MIFDILMLLLGRGYSIGLNLKMPYIEAKFEAIASKCCIPTLTLLIADASRASFWRRL